MRRVVGLDVSTSCVGVAVVESSDVSILPRIVLLDHINFKKENAVSIWTKADHVKNTFVEFSKKLDFMGVTEVFIEDAALKFSSGMSSAQTIASLLMFNGLVSYFVHEVFKITPQYIPPSRARKLCGLKMQQTKKCGKNHKQQVFEAMSASDLSHVNWPLKKNSQKVVDYAYDVTDAYVIARAGYELYKMTNS